MKKPYVHWPYPPSHSQLGWDHQWCSSEMAQNSLVGAAFCKGKLCSGNKPEPPCGLAQDPSACLVLTWASAPNRVKEGLGCLRLLGHCCLAGGLRRWKPTPNVFSSAEKADVA